MNPRLLMAVSVVVAGAACGQQPLTGGPGTGGATAAGGTTGAGGTAGAVGYAGSPGACQGKLTCARDTCTGELVAPVCISGALYCPPSTICPPDGGVDGATDGGCPSLYSDAGVLWCGCSSDTAPPPVCHAGTWTCPVNAGFPTVCPRYCSRGAPPPPGCTCDPTSGSITCRHDAGADAAPDGHGV